VVNREIKQQDAALSVKLQIPRSVQRTSFRARTTQVFMWIVAYAPRRPISIEAMAALMMLPGVVAFFAIPKDIFPQSISRKSMWSATVECRLICDQWW
jgi:hypothetical protein